LSILFFDFVRVGHGGWGRRYYNPARRWVAHDMLRVPRVATKGDALGRGAEDVGRQAGCRRWAATAVRSHSTRREHRDAVQHRGHVSRVDQADGSRGTAIYATTAAKD
jgi:hypothetical protein